jgi:UDP-N-acetylmuramoyl-tripeptide--D-alanyl-D-alanine ligase
MGFSDPFPGYSILLRVILFGLVPAFAVLHFFRLRRALHAFQLEGYRRTRFLSWCRANPRRALFPGPGSGKKPLVMTGRAWRILLVALLLSVAIVLVWSAVAHVAGGWPYDVAAWALSTTLVLVLAPLELVAADLVLVPVQRAVNGRFERAARRRLAEVRPVVVGVTGSFGKTSTKNAVAALAGPTTDVLSTPSSFNTPMGVCRAINEHLAPSHRVFVVEMGAYGEGEIRQLCELVRPSIGVLTAVGPAHLERFGSLEAIRRAKYELVEGLPSDGLAVMNVDDPEVKTLADATATIEVARYGLDASASPDVSARHIEVSARGTRFEIVDTRSGEATRVDSRLLGAYAIGHLLAAVAVARRLGRSLNELSAEIGELRAPPHRLELLETSGGVTVVDDAYNSNPKGAAAALDVLAAMPARRRVVVTPGIVELGEMQSEANRRFGRHAATVADTVIFVARLNRDALVAGANSADGDVKVLAVDSLAAAREQLERLLAPGDVVLFENDLPDHLEG